jgi:hypothetical protein
MVRTFRRLFWFGAGVGVTLWAQRRAAALTERFTPTAMRSSAQRRVRRVGSDLRGAVGDGRQAMAARAEELGGGAEAGRRTT